MVQDITFTKEVNMMQDNTFTKEVNMYHANCTPGGTEFNSFHPDTVMISEITDSVILLSDELHLSKPLIDEYLSLNLTRRDKALLSIIGSFQYKSKKGVLYANQSTIGDMAGDHGWKPMSRQRANEALSSLSAAGLINKTKQKKMGRRWSTVEITLTLLGQVAYAQIVDNPVPNLPKRDLPAKTGHSGIKNRTPSFSSPLREEDNKNYQKDNRADMPVDKPIGIPHKPNPPQRASFVGTEGSRNGKDTDYGELAKAKTREYFEKYPDQASGKAEVLKIYGYFYEKLKREGTPIQERTRNEVFTKNPMHRRHRNASKVLRIHEGRVGIGPQRH